MANNSRIGLFFLQAQSTFMATQSYIFYMYQEQATTTACSLTFLGFYHTILLNYLQLKYQGNNKTDPFQTHPKTMRVSVTSLLLYCLIYGVKQSSSSHPIYRKFSGLIHNVLVLLNSLSLASTASLLFPDPVSHVVFFLCFLLSGGEMLVWFFKKITRQPDEDESIYFQRRGATVLLPVWNYLMSRRMNMVSIPMEQRFSQLPV